MGTTLDTKSFGGESFGEESFGHIFKISVSYFDRNPKSCSVLFVLN